MKETKCVFRLLDLPDIMKAMKLFQDNLQGQYLIIMIELGPN